MSEEEERLKRELADSLNLIASALKIAETRKGVEPTKEGESKGKRKRGRQY